MRKLYFERQKVQKLVHWNERLEHGKVIARHDSYSAEPNGVKANVVMWILQVGDRTRHLIAIDIDKQLQESTLVNTAFGLVCPTCRTNEFIHPQLDFYPTSVREANRFDTSIYGYYCRCCGKLSKRG